MPLEQALDLSDRNEGPAPLEQLLLVEDLPLRCPRDVFHNILDLPDGEHHPLLPQLPHLRDCVVRPLDVAHLLQGRQIPQRLLAHAGASALCDGSLEHHPVQGVVGARHEPLQRLHGIGSRRVVVRVEEGGGVCGCLLRVEGILGRGVALGPPIPLFPPGASRLIVLCPVNSKLHLLLLLHLCALLACCHSQQRHRRHPPPAAP
mmetsp:Transcript_13760/g.31862  ORF Transcript_13760/g.31862 Transcript_13760/m.31862 type:complete len:204 (-) Transcript_13760:173-784(-)